MGGRNTPAHLIDGPLGAIAALGAALVALHGITSEKWEDWHTAFTALGGAVALVTLVEK